jgi:hypothetical protein
MGICTFFIAILASHDIGPLPRNAALTGDMLNRDLFSQYIDWDEFDAAMEKSCSAEIPWRAATRSGRRWPAPSCSG